MKSNHALCAKLIKKDLKEAFPTTKFSVKSCVHSIGINWENGPSTNIVEGLTCKYKLGYFDAMTDCYEITNNSKDLPTVSYINFKRDISEELIYKRFQQYKKDHEYLLWIQKITCVDEPHDYFDKWGNARYFVLSLLRNESL